MVEERKEIDALRRKYNRRVKNLIHACEQASLAADALLSHGDRVNLADDINALSEAIDNMLSLAAVKRVQSSKLFKGPELRDLFDMLESAVKIEDVLSEYREGILREGYSSIEDYVEHLKKELGDELPDGE